MQLDILGTHIKPFGILDKPGYSSCFNAGLNAFEVKIPHGKLFYTEHFFNKKISDRSVDYFLENDSNNWQTTNWRNISDDKFSKIKFKNINWKHDIIKLYGKKIPLPRYTSWYGDDNKSYTYSGIKAHPNQWNKGLLYIKNEIERIAQTSFNSVLLNWYRDGDDHLNWHADNEKELGKNPIITSVNFGAERDFVLRNNDNKLEKIKIPLKHGTLLIMSGEMQHFWQHSVPKRKKVNQARLNLTFRVIN